MQIAFAERDGAGVEQRLDDHRVALGPVAGKAGCTAGGRVVDGVEIVFERQRHAVQRADRGARRPALVGLARRRAYFIRLERDECVQALVGRRARQQRIRQRLGLDVAGADRLGRLGHAKIVKLRHGRVLNR